MGERQKSKKRGLSCNGPEFGYSLLSPVGGTVHQLEEQLSEIVALFLCQSLPVDAERALGHLPGVKIGQNRLPHLLNPLGVIFSALLRLESLIEAVVNA